MSIANINQAAKPIQINRETWKRVVAGDPQAFEQVVTRYQSLVSAVAFNIVGDYTASQDIAQDTFWAAWSTKETLLDTGRLRQWLCGIARNIARQWRRKQYRASEVDDSLLPLEANRAANIVEDFITKEEEEVVWLSLEQIPENYREVIVLRYRQGKAIEKIAQTLRLSEAAVRKRLSRGREMLKTHVARLVDGVLDRRNPNQTFTARVMAGIAGLGLAGNSASAGTSSMALSSSTLLLAKLLSTGSILGMLGGAMGAVGGLLGSWLGVWIPAQLAPTETERQLLLERGRNIMAWVAVFTLATMFFSVLLVLGTIDVKLFLIGMLSSVLVMMVAVVIKTVRTQQLVHKLRREISPLEDPNQSGWARPITNQTAADFQPSSLIQEGTNHAVWRGRKYTSEWKLAGIPLIDIQFSDPSPQSIDTKPPKERPTKSPASGPDKKPGHAFGWIAFGDVARGILLAVGGRAQGTIAVGGLAVGIIAIGGLSMGVLSLGGLALGLIAIGGGAIGYDAAGGGALGWHSAAGGAAIAYHVAYGGFAMAWETAVGGAAFAKDTNTPAAQHAAETESLFWLLKYHWWLTTFSIIFGSSFPLLSNLCYQRKSPAMNNKAGPGKSE